MTIHVLAYTPRAARHALADLRGRMPGGPASLDDRARGDRGRRRDRDRDLPTRPRLVPRSVLRARRLRPATRPRRRRARPSAASFPRCRGKPGRCDPPDLQRHPAPLLGRCRARQPDEHLETRSRAGRWPPRRLVEPDADEHVVPVELAARHDSARSGRRPSRRGRSARAGRGHRPRKRSAAASRARPRSSPSTDGRRRFSSRPSSRLPCPTKRATSPLTGRL